MTITFHAVNIIIDIMMVMVAFCYSPKSLLSHCLLLNPFFLFFTHFLIVRLPSHASCGPSMF